MTLAWCMALTFYIIFFEVNRSNFNQHWNSLYMRTRTSHDWPRSLNCLYNELAIIRFYNKGKLITLATSRLPKKYVCFKWAYFGNGPDAAASIAPTLIRHCPDLFFRFLKGRCHGNRFYGKIWVYAFIQQSGVWKRLAMSHSNSKIFNGKILAIHSMQIWWKSVYSNPCRDYE